MQQMCELKVFTLILAKISVDYDVIKETPLVFVDIFVIFLMKIMKIKRNHQRADECTNGLFWYLNNHLFSLCILMNLMSIFLH